MKKLLVLFLVFALAIGTVSCASSGENKDKEDDEGEKIVTYGSMFEFDDLEITVGAKDKVSFVKVKNQFSEHNGKDVVKVPVTIKNKKSETHGLNMFYYKYFGSQGTELDSVSAYFSDKKEMGFAGDLRTDASQEAFMYFLYDGDGEYVVEFSDLFSDPVEVKLDVKK